MKHWKSPIVAFISVYAVHKIKHNVIHPKLRLVLNNGGFGWMRPEVTQEGKSPFLLWADPFSWVDWWIGVTRHDAVSFLLDVWMFNLMAGIFVVDAFENVGCLNLNLSMLI